MAVAAILALAHLMVAAAVAAMLGLGAVAKLRHRPEWLSALAAYRLLPDALLGPVALLLPAVELVVALLLVSGIGQTIGSVGGAVLLIAFALAIAINLLRGRRHVDCGCDPKGRPTPIGWPLVGRNLLLAALLLAGLAIGQRLDLGLHLLGVMAGFGFYALIRAIALIQSFAPRSTGVANGAL